MFVRVERVQAGVKEQLRECDQRRGPAELERGLVMMRCQRNQTITQRCVFHLLTPLPSTVKQEQEGIDDVKEIEGLPGIRHSISSSRGLELVSSTSSDPCPDRIVRVAG